MLSGFWRLLPLLGAVVFVGAGLATAGLLARAEFARGADGRRRLQGARSRHQLWPDPARIPVAGRRYERLARRTLAAALLALAVTLAALGAR